MEMSVLLEEPHLHQVVVELLLVDNLLDDIGILEDEFHQSAVAQSAGDIGVVGFLGLGSHIVLAQFTVLVVHIPLVALGCHHGDAQFGIYLFHLSHSDTHRLDASGYDRADTTDACIIAEYLWKAFQHSSGYHAVLRFAIACEFSPASLCVGHDEFHLIKYTLTCGCQFIDTVGVGNHPERGVIATATADVARPMTTIM